MALVDVQAMETVIPPLLEAMLGSYQASIPEARDYEVLATCATIVTSLRNVMAPKVMEVFAAVFESTLSMITAEFESNPEHRINFYNLLHAIVTHCFDGRSSGTMNG
jgi:exportin-1